MRLHRGDISEHLPDGWDVAWLDLCSPFTAKLDALIHSAFQYTRKLVAVTVMAGRDKFHSHEERNQHMQGLLPAGWTIEDSLHYKDSRCPMNMYIARKK